MFFRQLKSLLQGVVGFFTMINHTFEFFLTISGVNVNSYCSYYSFPWESASTDSSNSAASALIIRPAQVTDLQAVATVLTQSFHVTTGPFFWVYPLIKLGIYEDLRTRLNSNSPNYICLVAIKSVHGGREEKIVGTVEMNLKPDCTWSSFTAKYPYIANLAVSNSYRRQGIAGQLLLKCEQVALDWGFSRISLHVLEDNEGAKRLYFSTGYRLHKVESSLLDWFFQRSKKLLLTKSLVIG